MNIVCLLLVCLFCFKYGWCERYLRADHVSIFIINFGWLYSLEAVIFVYALMYITQAEPIQELPKKFVSLHGASLPRSVRLKTHCGLEWKVEVVKCHGRIWLQKGWPEFEKHYRLEFGHLLCFRYIPNSAFQVSIFDRSFCEIHPFEQAPGKRARTTDGNSFLLAR